MVTGMKMHPAISASRHELEFFSNDFIYDGQALHSEATEVRADLIGINHNHLACSLSTDIPLVDSFF